MGRLINYSGCGYTTVSNAYLRDTSLSMEEMGLLTFLRSCSDGFVVSIRGLERCFNSGEKAIRSAMAKLIEKGYVVRTQTKSNGGKYGNMDYVSFDSLKEKEVWESSPNGCAQKRCAENRRAVEGRQRNTNIRSNNIRTTNESIERGEVAEATSPTPSKKSHFQKPTVEEIQAYLDEKDIVGIDAEYFWNFYEAKGWMVGKSPMKNWKACIATWQKRNSTKGSNYADNSRNEEESDIPNLDWLYDEWKTVGQDDS